MDLAIFNTIISIVAQQIWYILTYWDIHNLEKNQNRTDNETGETFDHSGLWYLCGMKPYTRISSQALLWVCRSASSGTQSWPYLIGWYLSLAHCTDLDGIYVRSESG